MGNQECRWAEAVVVGGGVVGLSVARALALRKMKVLLLERGERLGAEASRAAGGMLAPQCEADRADDFFELACASRDLYEQFASALLEETGVDVELDDAGTLYLAFTDADEKEIAQRFEWQRRASLPVEKISAREIIELEPWVSREVRGALFFPQDVQVENRKLVAALGESLRRLGVEVLTKTEATRLVVEGGRAAGIETSAGRVDSTVIVLACGAWSSLLVSNVTIEPVRGQMLCFALPSGERPISHVIYSPRGYLIPRRDGRLLAGSTTERAGFEAKVTDEGLRTITSAAKEIAPCVERLALKDSWAGLRPRARDDMPVLGASSEIAGLFYATGHYRNGILLAPITGELLAEQIVDNRTHALLNRFSPDRFATVGVS